MNGGAKEFVVIGRSLDTRDECAARVLCKTAEGLEIAVCGTPGDKGNLDTVRHEKLPFKMTVAADAMQRARMADIHF